MKSRVHPTYKTKYRIRNWGSYDRALIRRGDLTLWVSPEAIATWEPSGAEVRVACDVLNQMIDLGRPDSFAIGR